MNIFYLDEDIQKCAQYHCDKHVIKMILESAQLLSGAFRFYDLEYGYKLSKAHLNHPCSKWVRESIDNYFWLYELALNLNEEYKFRKDDYSKEHASFLVIENLPYPDHLPKAGLTPHPRCFPDAYKHLESTIEAYRIYYMVEKQYFAKWKRREVPEWYKP